jgi:two-component system phosphate regulon response regulator PhoB
MIYNIHEVKTMFNQLTVTIIHEDPKFVADLKAALEDHGMGVVTIMKIEDLDYEKLNTTMIVVHETFPGLKIKKLLIANKLNRNALTLVLTNMVSGSYLESLLDSGADDYLTRPYDIEDIYEKLLSVYRNGIMRPRNIYRFKDLILDTATRSAFINETSLDLTEKEFKLLKALVTQPFQPHKTSDLFALLWGNAIYEDQTTLQTIVDSLVRKLTAKGSYKHYIRKFGEESYMMDIR